MDQSQKHRVRKTDVAEGYIKDGAIYAKPKNLPNHYVSCLWIHTDVVKLCKHTLGCGGKGIGVSKGHTQQHTCRLSFLTLGVGSQLCHCIMIYIFVKVKYVI